MAETPENTFEAPNLPCKTVTVYADRAEVKRLLKTELKAGKNEVIVKKLPSSIDKESIRVDGRGNATIAEVQYQEKHVKKEEEIREAQKVYQEKLDQLQEQKNETDKEVARLNRKKEVLDGVATQIAKGTTTSGAKEEERVGGFSLENGSLDSLDQFMDYYGKTMRKIDDDLTERQRDSKRIREEINVAQRNLVQLGGTHSDTFLSREVSILLDASKEGEVELDVSYVVSQASWTPSYDVRVYTEDKQMKVHYYGLIQQNSGEDWADTDLSLSTAMPSIGGQVPELKTLRISFYRPPALVYKSASSNRGFRKKSKKGGFGLRAASFRAATSQQYEEDFELDEDLEALEMEENMMPQMAVMDFVPSAAKESVISTNFEIPRKGTIPSDNTSHKVNVTIVELEPNFEYETVPSKSPYAFLKARVVNKSNYPFLAGPVSVFLDNNFVAKSALKAVSPMEEFFCSLGVDPAVRVDYKPVRKFHEETGIFSKNSVTLYEQKIELKNTRAEPIKLRLLEHVPVSTDEKLKVTLVEPVIPKHEKEAEKLPYRLNKESNLEWDLKIPATETKTVVVKYSVDHPKAETVELKEDA